MSDIRQFLRYEIPGYILFIYTFLLILPFINPSKIEGLLPVLLQISISGFIIAIPIGWLLYQIFNEYIIEKHYSKKSVELIEKWSNEKNLSLPKYCYGELLNVGIYSSKNDEDNEQISFDSQLATETLRGYWTNYEARWIVAKRIPIISLFSVYLALTILPKMQVNPSIFHIDDVSICIHLFLLFMIGIISWSIYKSLDRIMNEINALEVFFVILRKNQIKKTMDKIYDENRYLFCWDKIPGNDSESDSEKLIEFLKINFDVNWVKKEHIKKSEDKKTIKVSTDKKFICIRLNDDKKIASLEIDDGRTDEFIMKTENGKLNIYELLFKTQEEKCRKFEDTGISGVLRKLLLDKYKN